MRIECLVFAGTLLLPFGQDTPTFRSSVEFSTVDVSVTRDGRPVTGLTIDNFRVFDNGVPQPLDRLMTDEVPLELTLVLDLSGSLGPAALQRLVTAAAAFRAGLRPGDTISLVLFTDKIVVPAWRAASVQSVRDSLAAVESSGRTALYDATFTALRLGHTAGSRAVLVLLTDGYDNASWLRPDEVLEALGRSNSVVYAVTATERKEGWVLPQERFVRAAAERTGGTTFRAGWLAGLDARLGEVLEHIRARYLLAYRPRNPKPGWHQIEVRLSGVKGDVVARRGYFVPEVRTR